MINQIATVAGVDKAGAMLGALIQPLRPLVASGVSLAMRSEKFHWLKFVGMIGGIGGLLMMLRLDTFSFSSDTSLGILYFCIANTTLGIGINLQSKTVKLGVPPLSVSFYSFLIGSVVIYSFFIYDAVSFDFSQLIANWYTIPSLAYAGIFASTVGNSLNLWALNYTTPTIVACYTFLQPVAGAVLSTVLLNEKLEWQSVVGSAIAIAGLGCVVVGRHLEQKKSGDEPKPASLMRDVSKSSAFAATST